MTRPVASAERLAAARTLARKGRREEAALLLEEVLETSPYHAGALVEMARVRLAEGDVTGARAAAELAVRVAPQDADAVAEVGNVRLAEGNAEAARACLEHAVEIAPDRAPLRAALAELLMGAGETEAALAELARATETCEEDADVLLVLGNLLATAGNLSAAETCFRRVVAIDPENAQGIHNLGNVAAEHGRPDEALALADRAHLLRPGDPAVLVTLAQRLLDAGEPARALRYARRAVALAPEDLAAADTFARVATVGGEGEAALRPLVEIVRRTPNDPAAAASLASKMRLSGRIAEALALAERVLAMAPDHPLAAAVRADCRLALGHHPAAGEGTGEGAAPDGPAAAGVEVPPTMGSLEVLAWLRYAGEAAGLPPDAPVRGPVWLAPLLGPRALAPDAPDGERPLLSLPAVAADPSIDVATAGARVPYLAADPGRRAAFVEALAAFPPPRIGIAWARAGRGLTLADVRAAFAGREGTLVSLVWDEMRHDLVDAPEVVDAGVHVSDLGVAAAALAALDGFVGPDGVPLHLAGALGRPGIAVAVPAAPWYLHPERDGHLAWYPTLRRLPRPFEEPAEAFRARLGEALDVLLARLAGQD